MLSDKASRARSFHQNRGRRVNGEGEYVDGVVPDLRLKKYVEPETKRKGKVVHRLSRGVEERDAEQEKKLYVQILGFTIPPKTVLPKGPFKQLKGT